MFEDNSLTMLQKTKFTVSDEYRYANVITVVEINDLLDLIEQIINNENNYF